REVVITLLDGGGAVAAAALRELGEPWAAIDPLPPELVSPFLAADAVTARAEAADAALVVAARHGHTGGLREVVESARLPPGLRRTALELLGDVADRAAIGELTAVAARDPLLFGGPLLAFLRGCHRRGHFADDRAAGRVVGVALADHSIAPREVATVLFTCR